MALLYRTVLSLAAPGTPGEVVAVFPGQGAQAVGMARAAYEAALAYAKQRRTFGKAIGNGMPISGVVFRPEVSDEFGRSVRYFNTFGGSSITVGAE